MSHERIVWPPQRPIEDPYGKMEDAFADFISRHDFTVSQMREAYDQLLDNSRQTIADPAVIAIFTEMKRLESEHFPLNRFAKCIGAFENVENDEKNSTHLYE